MKNRMGWETADLSAIDRRSVGFAGWAVLFMGALGLSTALPSPARAADMSLAGPAAMDLSRLEGEIVALTDESLRKLDEFSFDMTVRLMEPGEGHLFSLHEKWNGDGFYLKYLENGRLELAFGGNGDISRVVSPDDPIEIGKWHRLSGVKQGEVATLFVNGKKIASDRVAREILDTTQDFQIARSSYSAPLQIRDFRLWRDVLDAGQITDLVTESEATRLPEPLIHYDFTHATDGAIENQANENYTARIISDDDDLGFVNIAALSDRSTTEIEGEEDQRDYAIDLTDADSGVSVDDIALSDGPGGFAIQLNVNFRDSNPGIIASGKSETGEYFILSHSRGAILFDIGKGSRSTRIVTPTDIVEPGEWITLTGLYEDGLASIVFNDVRVASYPAPTPVGSSSMALKLGMGAAAKAMQIKEVSLWQRALSDEELVADAAGDEALDREGLLLKLGPWDQPITARTLPDDGPQKREGELTGRIERLSTAVDGAGTD